MVAMFAGDPQLLSLVGDMVRVTQNTDAAVAYGRAAARVLEGVILGSAPLEAVEEAVRTLRVGSCGTKLVCKQTELQVADAGESSLATVHAWVGPVHIQTA